MARSEERSLWNSLDAVMHPYWHAQRHEDRYSPDIPDVSYALNGVDGWIELKVIPAPDTDRPLRIPHLTPGQVNWLCRRGETGSGHCFVLVQVGKQYVLIPWSMLSQLRCFMVSQWITSHGFPKLHPTTLIRRLQDKPTSGIDKPTG